MVSGFTSIALVFNTQPRQPTAFFFKKKIFLFPCSAELRPRVSEFKTLRLLASQPRRMCRLLVLRSARSGRNFRGLCRPAWPFLSQNVMTRIPEQRSLPPTLYGLPRALLSSSRFRFSLSLAAPSNFRHPQCFVGLVSLLCFCLQRMDVHSMRVL